MSSGTPSPAITAPSKRQSAAQTPPPTSRPVEIKQQNRTPTGLSQPATAQARGQSTPPADRMGQGDCEISRPSKTAKASATVGLASNRKDASDSGFLPYVPQSEDVAKVLVKYIADLRGASLDLVFAAYHKLESGFHLVYERELCLEHHDLTPCDHKGKRSLRLIGHEKLVEAIEHNAEALKVLARVLEKGRVVAVRAANKAEKGRHATKPLVIDISNLVAEAKDSYRQDIELYPSDHGMAASWKAPLRIRFDHLTEIKTLTDPYIHKELGLASPLGSCAFLGGGGGSDVVQAAALAKLMTKYNLILKVPAVISIRTLYSKSTSAGEKRNVWNPRETPRRNLLESSNGDLKIEPSYEGNARFVEDSITGTFSNVRLVIDDKSQDELRCPRYEGAIGKGVDSIVVIDTGGDVLGGENPSDLKQKQTPDQDSRTQLATAKIAADKNLNALVAIAALGVDAPADTQEKLEDSKAMYYRFTSDDKKFLKELYSLWKFNGLPASLEQYPERYGKTPFAMLASFSMKRGEGGAYHALPLPASVINDFSNPWQCITWVTPEMSCLVLANQRKLLERIMPERLQKILV